MLSHRAARKHLVASRLPKYFLRLHTAGSVSPGSGRPVRRKLGYGPAVRRKPFRPHLAVGALSCAIQPQRTQHAPTAHTRQAAGAHPGGFPNRRPSPTPIEPHLHPASVLRSSCARRGITPAYWLRTPLGVGPTGLPPASNTASPARNTTSADFSTASDALTSIAVPHHPANQKDGASGTPVETSPNKTNGLHRAPIASTRRPLDEHRASPCDAGSPGPPRLIRAAHRRRLAPMRHVFLRSRLRTPASSPPSLTTEQLPSACGWCHQPPQGTRTPELLVMSRAHRACGCRDRNQARAPRGVHAPTGHVS